MSSLRKRTHSLAKDINSSPITTNPAPRKKTKKSSTTTTPKKVITTTPKSNYSLRTSVRPKDKQQNGSSIGTNSSSNDGDEVNGNLTRSTSSLSIEDFNNIGSNASSPLSSPPSSPNLENDAENDNGDNGDIIEPLLLPNVVWVNDEKRGWWPSEIISKDKSEKPLLVRLFGQKQPCTLELHNISKSNILPFHDELFVQLRKTGENSNMKELFNKAIAEAVVKETEDNDGLPSKDFAFQMVVDSSPNNQKKKNGRKSLINKRRTKGTNHSSALEKEIPSKEKFTVKQEISNLSDIDLEKDETLQIPGECVLAYAERKYYPAKIIGYNEPDKYKVLFCDNSNGTVKRKDFFTKYEDGFKTCELGIFEMHSEDPNYEEPELVKKIQSLEPILSRILRGEEDSSWRFQFFYKGGKKLKLLASKVSPGPFSLDQFGLIAKVLRGIFIPEIADSIDRKNKIFPLVKLAGNVKNSVSNVEDHEEKLTEDNKSVNVDESITMQQQNSLFDFEFLSSDLKLRFVNDVLLPETIIRLVMNEEGIGYEEADRKILDGYDETRWGWVEHLMAERASFQVGSESLREKLK